MIKIVTDRDSFPTADVKQGISRSWIRVAGDSLSLAGLQLRLMRLDAKTWLGTTALTAVVLTTGVAFVLAGLPFLFGAAALGLSMTGLDWLWSLLIVGGAGFLIGILLVLAAITRLRKTLHVFERSKSEMANNLQWLKKQLSDSRQ